MRQIPEFNAFYLKHWPICRSALKEDIHSLFKRRSLKMGQNTLVFTKKV